MNFDRLHALDLNQKTFTTEELSYRNHNNVFYDMVYSSFIQFEKNNYCSNLSNMSEL